MTSRTAFHLAAPSSWAPLPMLRIYHPSFSQVFRVCGNCGIEGIDAGGEHWDYLPMLITLGTTRDNLNFGVKTVFGDLGDKLPAEIDRVIDAGTQDTIPTVNYLEFRSDDLTDPMYESGDLEMGPITFNHEGASFEAVAPAANTNRTGEIYSLERFPCLRGLLG